jgi:hypothetical protein
MSPCVLTSVLHELLKLALGVLRFLDHPKSLCSELVLKQLGTYEVKDQGNTLLDLDTPILPCIPILD